MADVEKKVRVSGEQPRVAEPAGAAPILPTTEKPLPPKPSLHPAFYVVYVLPRRQGLQFTNQISEHGSVSVEE